MEIQNTVKTPGLASVLEGQSLFDITIQACGSIEAAFSTASLNSLTITDILIVGSELAVPDPLNKSVSEYYRLKRLRPATDVTIGNLDALRNEGIDFWAVEVDFIVT